MSTGYDLLPRIQVAPHERKVIRSRRPLKLKDQPLHLTNPWRPATPHIRRRLVSARRVLKAASVPFGPPTAGFSAYSHYLPISLETTRKDPAPTSSHPVGVVGAGTASGHHAGLAGAAARWAHVQSLGAKGVGAR